MNALRALILTAASLLGSSALAATYTVKPGDTLYSISQKANLDPAQLLKLNRLQSSTIQVGQKLEIGGSASASSARPSTPTASRSGNGNTIRAAAARFLNIRYVLGGNGAGGIDCSAYTRAVFQQLGVSLPRTARAQFGVGTSISRGNLQTGDLVFFSTMGGGVSHVGIYLGNGQFANANSYNGRTMIESMTTSYWAPRYVGARRVL
ncbi:C40 family peptidase [Deinococcus aquiradiocola]|uniref:Peptidase n=1 Tax=Deinococcus aquiradiocola TaxID=393059 RepID=A0A917PDM0_9DEIO|nr:LysM peptidoglycan-binding domain-containing C40 family peptidase [Deinococcus aquiradiocola]GGJ72008.1 peptidase [Deinococcus aquiradiocola]